MTSLAPPNAIDVEALLWRQGGMWKVAIRLPQWLFRDIEDSGQATIMLHDGMMNLGSSVYSPVYDYLLSNATFELINEKANKQE